MVIAMVILVSVDLLTIHELGMLVCYLFDLKIVKNLITLIIYNVWLKDSTLTLPYTS